MAVPQTKQPKLSYEEYLAFERTAEERHTFWDGEIFAMSGGSLEHSTLETNLVVLLQERLKGKPCRAFTGNRRYRSLQPEDRAVYPDASVICGRNQPHPEDPDASTNPVVVFEVLSASTESFDRGKKFAFYRNYPTLCSYVLVSQEQLQVEHFHRRGELWILEVLGPDQVLTLPELEISLDISAIYQDVTPRPVLDDPELWARRS